MGTALRFHRYGGSQGRCASADVLQIQPLLCSGTPGPTRWTPVHVTQGGGRCWPRWCAYQSLSEPLRGRCGPTVTTAGLVLYHCTPSRRGRGAGEAELVHGFPVIVISISMSSQLWFRRLSAAAVFSSSIAVGAAAAALRGPAAALKSSVTARAAARWAKCFFIRCSSQSCGALIGAARSSSKILRRRYEDEAQFPFFTRQASSRRVGNKSSCAVFVQMLQ